MPIKENMRKYLEIKGISEYKFYQESGVSRGTLANSGINEETIAKFFAYFPDADANEIFKGEVTIKIDNIAKSKGVEEESDKYVTKANQIISEKDKAIGILEDTVGILTRQVDDLLKDKTDLRKDKEIYRDIVEKKLTNIA